MDICHNYFLSDILARFNPSGFFYGKNMKHEFLGMSYGWHGQINKGSTKI